MKSLSKMFAVVLRIASLSFGGNVAVSAETEDGAGDVTEQATPELVGGTPAYRVGYMYSTTAFPRKAMAISILITVRNCATVRSGGARGIMLSAPAASL